MGTHGTHDDDSREEVEELEAQLAEAREKLAAAEWDGARLEKALRLYVLAQSRMLERWSEADIAVRAQLWANLHLCEDAGRSALTAREKADG